MDFKRIRRARSIRAIKLAGLLKVPEGLVDLIADKVMKEVKKFKASEDKPYSPKYIFKRHGEYQIPPITIRHEEALPFIEEVLPDKVIKKLDKAIGRFAEFGIFALIFSIDEEKRKMMEEANEYGGYGGAYYWGQKMMVLDVPLELTNNKNFEDRLKSTIRHELRHHIQAITNFYLKGINFPASNDPKFEGMGGFGIEKMKSPTQDELAKEELDPQLVSYLLNPEEFQPWIGSQLDTITRILKKDVERDIVKGTDWMVGLHFPPEDKRKEAKKIMNSSLSENLKNLTSPNRRSKNNAIKQFNEYFRVMKKYHPKKYNKAVKYIHTEIQEKFKNFVNSNLSKWGLDTCCEECSKGEKK